MILAMLNVDTSTDSHHRYPQHMYSITQYTQNILLVVIFIKEYAYTGTIHFAYLILPACVHAYVHTYIV